MSSSHSPPAAAPNASSGSADVTETTTARRRTHSDIDADSEKDGQSETTTKKRAMARKSTRPRSESEDLSQIRRLVMWGLCGWDADQTSPKKGRCAESATARLDHIAAALDKLSRFLWIDNCSQPTSSKPYRAEMDKYGTATAALAIIKTNSESERILQEGFSFLGNWMFQNPQGITLMNQLGAAAVVVSAMRRFPHNAELQVEALRAMFHMCDYAATDELKTHFVRDLRGAELTVMAMASHRHDCSIFESAIELLESLCQVPDLRPDLAEERVLSQVVISVEDHDYQPGGWGDEFLRLASEVVIHLGPCLGLRGLATPGEPS